MLTRRGARTDPCGTLFLRRRNLLLSFLVVKVKLRLPTISMIMRTMCLSGSNCSSLQVKPRSHTVSHAAVRSTNTAPAFFSRKAILAVLCQQGDLVYGRPPVSKARLLPRKQQWVDDWIDTSVDESLEDFKGDTQQRYGMVGLWVPQWLFWLGDRNY